MYRMMVIDIDGTLVNSHGEITESTKNALLQAQEKGVLVVLASGRVSTSTIEFAKQIGLNGYVISGNGSIVSEIENNNIIYSDCMSSKDAINVIKLCNENSINCNLYTQTAVLTNKVEHSALFYSMENKKLPEEKRTQIYIYDDLVKALQRPENSQISKITICDKDQSVFRSIIRKLREFKNLLVLDVSHCSKKKIRVGSEEVEVNYYYTEVSKAGVDKWGAAKFLADKLEIPYSEIIAMGDNANDITMVKNAGLGVIMANAAPIYKEQADYVAPSNDEDGVADVVNKYILNN